ncbi:MIP/aquaporin family protein [Bacillus sp. ISL-46]|uniref:MIP/aquaporin family protein n=1 Tax=Bacillus sp. ISL-46 TaxID=2819129 RepID=UPI0020364F91|nr:aquaporin [Bacillus sp. ISL-46]
MGICCWIPAVIFGGISGNHINPAYTIALAVNHLFPMEKVIPYITEQLIGAFIGAMIVWIMYKPFMDDTEDDMEVLGCFGLVPSYKKTYLNAFFTEFIGTFILVFCAVSVPLDVLESLNIPVLNLGPVGKDAHKWTERLDVDNAFEPLRDMLSITVNLLLAGDND